jgi:hypothetical protein
MQTIICEIRTPLYTPTLHNNMKMTILHSSELKNFVEMPNKWLKIKSSLILSQRKHQTFTFAGSLIAVWPIGRQIKYGIPLASRGLDLPTCPTQQLPIYRATRYVSLLHSGRFTIFVGAHCSLWPLETWM